MFRRDYEFDLAHEWDDMYAFSHKTIPEVFQILDDWGYAYKEEPSLIGDEAGYDDIGDRQDFEIFIGGYWSDYAPVIVIEDGIVRAWYRSDAWE